MLKILLLFIVLALSAADRSHFYRKDYTFFEEFDAYYKLHWDKDGVSWNTAFMACDDEGAKLFYPREEGEWVVAKNLTALLAEAPNTTDVIVGIHDEIGQGEFVTVDGTVTPSPVIEEKPVLEGHDCVIMDMETGEYKTDFCVTDPLIRRLFICKKVDEKPCRTIDLGYKYSKETKKCYKINKRERSWQEAWHTCFMEGGLLVTPENSAEADVIYKIISNRDSDYYSGFRRIFPGSDFYTVKGQKLEESGFQRWRDRDSDDQHDCGVIFLSSSYNTFYYRTKECHKHLPFICEMAAKAY